MAEHPSNAPERGSIEIHTENIFPIIKKWLYSDRDIFIRELISNGCDAITKLKKLASLGEANIEEQDYRITVSIDEKAGTLSFTDNGIGMTAEEVKKYINQVAFSSAEEFLDKFKGKEEGDQIIGHFGLGFYSAFMVSTKVELETLSYQEGAEAVLWSCKGDTEYEMTGSDRKQRGTTITLYLSDEDKEFFQKHKVQEILRKYCAFLPYPIYLEKVGEEPQKDSDGNVIVPSPINDTKPLWQKAPKDCTDEEYKEFYQKVFMDFNEPLFWIHLNVDYPFRLKGILYFPKIDQFNSSLEGSIKLYNNQVYVADNIKEVIPEFLLMLRGVIDCPDLPLNVSRSFLQSDREIQKIPAYITRKVADRLMGIFKNEREDYENYWKDIHTVIKFGCMRDDKYYDKMKDGLIYKLPGGDYTTMSDYLAASKDKHENTIYYINDEHGQAPYAKMYEEAGLQAVVLDTPIDPHFISFMEMKLEGKRFSRVDAELPDDLKGEGELKDDALETVKKAFQRATGKEKLEVKAQALKQNDTPAVAQVNEFLRRSDEMRATGGGGMPWMGQNMIADAIELVVNPASPVIQKIASLEEQGDSEEQVNELCLHVYDLARLTAGLLEPSDMAAFIQRSGGLLNQIVND